MITEPHVLRRIHLLSSAKFGFALGAVLSLVPAFICGTVFVNLASAFYRQLNIWRSIEFASFAGQHITVNFVELLQLQDMYAMLQRFNDISPALFIALVLLLVLCIGLLSALLAVAAAGLYNSIASLSGGLTFDLAHANASSPVLIQPAPLVPLAQATAVVDAWLAPSNGQGQPIPIDKPLMTIGSAPDNRLMLTSSSLARRHAEIRFEGGRYILHDLSGRGNVFVNGRPIVDANMLRDNFRVQFGDTEFVFRQR